ncbi:MAG: ribbon-helix-helix protein, CopG family [Candidatus Tectomicrobia bacterium]|uniref:Ribbon-helix-helix protein, CopG family n=1 Tax=Tectimicrobiota bacterium TaxID=2528274 RepID=A0A932FVG7_UNCTE|nr:ribbon-helix-helix protein, CopG family [Candidatus Tectomicrobia bacterium]
MVQTEIQLTEEQMAALEELAKRRNVSVADLVCEGIDNLLRSAAIPGDVERKQRALAVDGRFRSGLRDLSRRHDDYLLEALDT